MIKETYENKYMFRKHNIISKLIWPTNIWSRGEIAPRDFKLTHLISIQKNAQEPVCDWKTIDWNGKVPCACGHRKGQNKINFHKMTEFYSVQHIQDKNTTEREKVLLQYIISFKIKYSVIRLITHSSALVSSPKISWSHTD